jgi:HKD family nuclease
MNSLKTITNENNTSFEKFFIDSIKKSNSIKIASGYVGIDGFKKADALLRDIVKNGGSVVLIFGLGRWEGISPKLEVLLRDFHQFVSNINSHSGVFFCQKDKYHGKIYLFQNASNKWASVGSSNFSPTGFGGYQEANIEMHNNDAYQEVEDYFNRLLVNNAKPITVLTFPSKEKEQLAKEVYTKTTVPNNFRNLPLAFKLEIKPEPISHINLFAGSGRLNSTTGLYTKRPWYEVELGITVNEVKNNLLPYLPIQKDPYKIKLVDEGGNILNANFKRKTGSSNDKKTLHETGLDFMTGSGTGGGKNGRVQLGYFIKDKLIDAGLLRYGEVITEDILDMYGNHFLEFRSFPGKKDHFLITFDPS